MVIFERMMWKIDLGRWNRRAIVRCVFRRGQSHLQASRLRWIQQREGEALGSVTVTQHVKVPLPQLDLFGKAISTSLNTKEKGENGEQIEQVHDYIIMHSL